LSPNFGSNDDIEVPFQTGEDDDVVDDDGRGVIVVDTLEVPVADVVEVLLGDGGSEVDVDFAEEIEHILFSSAAAT
jgi:hypothetical protein